MKLINKNGIDIIIKKNTLTPRSAVCCYFAVDKAEKFSGVYSLFSRLLLQGTKTRTAEDIAFELENDSIELGVKFKQDFFRASALFLNEDINLTLELLSDILQNSTFVEFEKEVFKLKGEIISSLDIPKVQVTDAFVKEIFKEHYYSNTYTKTLEELNKIKKEDVIEVLFQIMKAKKVITFVGDFENEDEIIEKLSSKLGFMQNSESKNEIQKVSAIKEDTIVKTAKDDVNQAQIIQGWHVESFDSADYPKLVVMNNLLGASGLSSRLFYELRDKQGLAYHVRSSYEVLKQGAIINFYIATTPENIKKSLDGFRKEIEKLQNNLPTEDELQGAKENVLGKLEYLSQTNMQQASSIGYDWIMGLGINFSEKYKEMVENVAAEDLSNMAKKYLSGKSVISVLAPKKYLQF